MKRNIFFKLDLLICSVWALFVLRFWVANLLTSFCLDEATLFPEWTLPFVAYTVLMRLSLSFMMLRKEKRGLAVAGVYMLVGGACWFLLPWEVMTHALRDMYNYLTVATDYAFSPRWITSRFSPFLFYKTVGLLFPFWLLVMPVVYFLVYRKRCIPSGIESRWGWSGLYLWKDALRNKYLAGCAFLLVAWCFGIVMNEWLSLVAMLVIPAFAYYCLSRGWGAKFRWGGCLLVSAASCLLWFAQYEIGDMRERLLWISALLVLVPVGFVWRMKGWLDGVWTFVAVGILLPSFCLGYDVYTVKEAKRIGNFRDEMCLTGMLKVEDGEGHIALRDRYRLLVPLSYADVEADRLPLVKVNDDGKWKIFNIGKMGYPKGDLNLLEEKFRGRRHFYIIEIPLRTERSFEACVKLARQGDAEAYKELARHYEKGTDVEQSYANMLTCILIGNRLNGRITDPLSTEFKANHPFRVSIELLEGMYLGEEERRKMRLLESIAPSDAKAITAMSMITNRSERKQGLSMLDDAIEEGSEVAVILKTSYLESSKDIKRYERHLKAYTGSFPFFYNKLGKLYEKRDMNQAVEYYKTADSHAMLDEHGANFLLNFYKEEMENGKATYNERELRRLRLISGWLSPSMYSHEP